MDFKLFSENQASIQWDDATNRRIVLTKQYPELIDLAINEFGHFSSRTVQPILPRGHHGSCYEIHYVAAGAQPFYTYPSQDAPEAEATLHWIHGGEVFITRPYEYHSTGAQPQQRGNIYWIQLDIARETLLNQVPACSTLLKEALKSVNTHVLPCPQSTANRLVEAFNLLADMNEAKLYRACSLLTLFIFEIADRAARDGVENDQGDSASSRAQEAISFIRDNLLMPNLNLAMVAEHMHYTRPYASTFFKRETGMTIHEFIMHSKIDYACELLKEHSVTKVASLLNFSSSQHFYKVFREQTGIAPSEFVRQLAEDQIKMDQSAGEQSELQEDNAGPDCSNA
ncbi:MAG: helix-turn-helix transcriptional regulator [Clostridia bacterium]|nr:helix-turn-helix transcriptional regulator [Clostridia bacterium]